MKKYELYYRRPRDVKDYQCETNNWSHVQNLLGGYASTPSEGGLFLRLNDRADFQETPAERVHKAAKHYGVTVRRLSLKKLIEYLALLHR